MERSPGTGATSAEVGRLRPGELTALLARLAEAPPADLPRRGPGPGDTLGRFRLDREIGRGGFGRVFQATDLELGREVALKLIRPDCGGATPPDEWIRREAEAAAHLRHRGIVTLHDAGHFEGGAYLVYELLHGETLADRLLGRSLPRGEARHVLTEVALALAHAHAAGVDPPRREAGQHLPGDGRRREAARSRAGPGGGGHRPGRRVAALHGTGAGARGAGRRPRRRLCLGEAGRAAPRRGAARGAAGAVRPDASRGRCAASPTPPAPRIRRSAPATPGSWWPRSRPSSAADIASAWPARSSRSGRWRCCRPSRACSARDRRRRPRSGSPSPISSGPRSDAALDGLSEHFMLGLQAAAGVEVIDRARILRVLRATGKPAGPRLDAGAVAFAAEQAGGAAVLVPSARRSGELIALTLEAQEPGTREVLASATERVAPRDEVLVPAVSRVVGRVVEALEAHQRQPHASELALDRTVTASLEAHRRYTAGRLCEEAPSHGDSWSRPDCASHYREALAFDPDYPLAHFALAREAVLAGRSTEELQAVLRPALARLERVPPRERAQLLAWQADLDGRPDEAVAILRRAQADWSDDARLAFALGELLEGQGRLAEAVATAGAGPRARSGVRGRQREAGLDARPARPRRGAAPAGRPDGRPATLPGHAPRRDPGARLGRRRRGGAPGGPEGRPRRRRGPGGSPRGAGRLGTAGGGRGAAGRGGAAAREQRGAPAGRHPPAGWPASRGARRPRSPPPRRRRGAGAVHRRRAPGLAAGREPRRPRHRAHRRGGPPPLARAGRVAGAGHGLRRRRRAGAGAGAAHGRSAREPDGSSTPW